MSDTNDADYPIKTFYIRLIIKKSQEEEEESFYSFKVQRTDPPQL